MDNEILGELQAALTTDDYIIQLVPPKNHKKNAAERAIQTFKNHFLAGLALLPPDFPLSSWDYLLKQAQITLLLLPSVCENPKVSAYAYLFGNFDFNQTLLVPPGIKTVIHNRPASRPSWGLHRDDAFFIGPALQHYRCVKYYILKMRSTCISDTIAFFPTTVPAPSTTLNEHLRQANSNIVTLLISQPSH